MPARLEQIQRGTPDLPFARYSFHYVTPRHVTANTHWHPEQEILYVISGSIEVMIGKQPFLISEKQICFVAPNVLHSVVTSAPNTVYHAFVFSYDLLTLPDMHFFQTTITEPMRKGELIFPAVLDINDSHYPIAAQALDRICEYNMNDPGYKLVVFQALVTLYTMLQDTLIPSQGTESSADNLAVKTCLDYMREHYAQRITLEQLARLVHLHPNYLCSLFKTYTGQTAFQLLIHIRLENAAALLERGRLSVSQVAILCGFESVSFFSRKFKQIMGCTPKDYCNHSAKKVY